MKKSIVGLLALCSCICFSVGCKKIDTRLSTGQQDNHLLFFDSGNVTDPTILGILASLKAKDERRPFVDRLVSARGIPVWRKAQKVAKTKVSNQQLKSIDFGDTTFVYTPFISTTYENVQGILMSRIIGTDTTYKFISANDYHDYPKVTGGNNTNSTDIAELFISFEWEVFDHTSFHIRDYATLFASHIQDSSYLFTESVEVAERTCTEATSTIVKICIQTETWDQWRFNQVVDPGEEKNDVAGEECKLYFFQSTIETECSGGGGGSYGHDWGYNIGGGTSLASPPGGLYTVNDPHPFVYDPDDAIKALTNHGPYANFDGWEPNSGTLLTPVSPGDSLISLAVSTFDSAFNKLMDSSLNLKKEIAATIVKDPQGNLKLINLVIAPDGMAVEPNFHLPQGYQLLGSFHCHPDSLNNPLDRSAPSWGDIWSLRFTQRQNFFEIVECGNKRFAVVIDDINKAINAENKYDPVQGMSTQADIAGHTSPGTANWQEASRLALLQMVGSATTSGISLYQTTDVGKQTFSKFN